MKPSLVRLAMAGTLALLLAAPAWGDEEGQLGISRENGQGFLQVRGAPGDDWRIVSSPDLVNWQRRPELGTLLSGGADAFRKAVSDSGGQPAFFRAIKTTGMYDRDCFRTVYLTFGASNWPSLLTRGRTTGSNTPCVFLLDNGLLVSGAGARYRGNTSFTGFGSGVPVKKSINLDLDSLDPATEVMGFKTLNFNNAYGDETMMRETLYFNVMRNYTVCPHGAMVQLFINNTNWGVYSHAQQQNNELIDEYFPSHSGDRWRAPNMAGGGAGGGGSALNYLGTNLSTYRAIYELKDGDTNLALPRLVNAIQVLNNTPTNEFRDKVETVLAVDRWLWFLAVENVFADDDSYWNKGADYMIYYEPESGRLHPVEHDGNEAFVAGDAALSPVQGATDTARPVLRRLLGIPELRQRYLAHMRTVIQEHFNPATMTELVHGYRDLSIAAIVADPKRGYASMASYTNDLNALKTFITNRYRFLTNHAELKPLAPAIEEVAVPEPPPQSTEPGLVAARVTASGTNGIDSVWLHYRSRSYGRFTAVQMIDDGTQGDAVAEDGVYSGHIPPHSPGTKIRFYVEARSSSSPKAAAFSPARAEQVTLSYRVGLTIADNSPVVINELMADNLQTVADPQGEFDDWIELRNLGTETVLLDGKYLSDEPTNPRKWPFPAGTRIDPGGYLLVWADEDGPDTPGLHASFKLGKSGEDLFLVDTDANLNAILDHVSFGPQQTDLAYGRTPADPAVWAILQPTPGAENK